MVQEGQDMSYKDEARTFLEKAGIDPDIFDWDIAEIMADFARVKVGETEAARACLKNWT
jgi:hypothetical protein